MKCHAPTYKEKAAVKNKNRNKKGKFGTKTKAENDAEVNILGEQLEMDLDNTFSERDWKNDEVSDWESDIDLKVEQDIQNRLLKVNFELKWRPNAKLEKKKCGPYKVDKTPKSTYYDKWGPSDS
ncbi:14307_t:CDS:2 [Funneliformis caledonium]|uniref:14307_t:CDS:1 n=1 Tax=Funneliformis caledonium TaxID=1117310 RepID=A0A9N9ECI6_9GLOM|nr:14307_t:CDS:2 [Funneliformis caledonium]